MMVIAILVISAICIVCGVYSVYFATTNGMAIHRVDAVGAAKRARKRVSTVAPGFDPEQESQRVLDAMHPHFKDIKADGTQPSLTGGDFFGDAVDEKTGLSYNLLTEKGKQGGTSYYNKEALHLLTRAIDISKMIDAKGIYEQGADQLNADPHKFFAMSEPTTKLKAFVSHTWDSKEFVKETAAADRREHSEQTTKAIMWHIKFGMMNVGNFLSHLIIAALVTFYPPVGFGVGLIVMFGLPLWIVSTNSPFVMWFLGLSGNQFWMDKATIHQANRTKRALGKPYTGTEHEVNRDTLKEPEAAERTSKYRVLNQAGVGLFDHFLTQSQELWVLFIPRYITRVWCIYEMAYWLRLMKEDKKRKIKMIPIERNIGLYDSLPLHQGVVAFMSCVYCAVITIAGTYFHKKGPNSASLGVGLELAIVGGILFCLVIGAFVLAFFYKKDIKPAMARRATVVSDLKTFTWQAAVASNAADKQHVEGMIVSLWSKQLKKDHADATAMIAEFEKYVQTDVANQIDDLLKSGERDLLMNYIAQILSVIILDGLIIGLIALDIVRPIIAPTYGIWASSELSTSYGMFFAIAMIVILIDIAIFAWVKRKWGKIM